jgi:hypothetical protein
MRPIAATGPYGQASAKIELVGIKQSFKKMFPATVSTLQ